MPRNVASSIENNFVNGLVTEATALNFPEAAASETFNCVFLQKGDFKRRYGFDFEPGYSLIDVNRSEVVVNTFFWQNAAGSGNNNFVVLQVGSLLHFFSVGATGALSDSISSETIDLTAFSPVGAVAPSTIECQFAYGRGYLFVVHPQLEPFYVEYDPVLETFTATQINIQIRDFDGIAEPVDNDTRASTLSDTHKYNLYNQGWEPFETGGVGSSVTVVTGSTIIYPASYDAGDPLAVWDANRTDYPSNSDVWWLFKDASDVFQPKLANTQLRGNSPAPKGHYLVDAFNIDRAAVAGFGTFSVETSGTQRPQAVTFFAGRVWYAGVDAQGFSNRVYFSQLVKGDEAFGRCYQQNDPTSEHAFDLLATDGGAVEILECGTIVKMFPMQNSIIIFATNGIWTISGSQGVGFTAGDYSVKKLSSTPAVSASSFVDVAGMPMWWNTDGIYTMGGNDTLGQMQVTSLTEKKIKTLFDAIPAANKSYAKGYYNTLTKVVQWCYRTTAPTTLSERYEFDGVLSFNVITQAFYPWTITGSDVSLNNLVAVQGTASTTQSFPVTDSLGVVVVDSLSVEVTAREVQSSSIASLFKYLVSYPDGSAHKLTFAEESDTSYRDFVSYDDVGVDYDSYVISGFKVHGEAQKKFQANYVYVFCDATLDNKFYFQAIWDYATSLTQSDLGSRQLVQLLTQSRNYRYRRLKVRGMGIAVQFKLSSFSGKPFTVVGWSGFETGNSSI